MSRTRHPRMTFDRTDYQWSYLAIGLGLLATVLLAVVMPLIDWLRGVPFTAVVPAPEALALAAPPAADGVLLAAGTVSLEMASAPATAWLIRIGLGILFAAVATVVLLLLRRFMRSVEAGSPFTQLNVRRLQVMAALLVVSPIVGFFLQGLANAHLISLALGNEELLFLSNTGRTGLVVGAAGVVLALIAEVFRRGVELEEDVEGLV